MSLTSFSTSVEDELFSFSEAAPEETEEQFIPAVLELPAEISANNSSTDVQTVRFVSGGHMMINKDKVEVVEVYAGAVSSVESEDVELTEELSEDEGPCTEFNEKVKPIRDNNTQFKDRTRPLDSRKQLPSWRIKYRI